MKLSAANISLFANGSHFCRIKNIHDQPYDIHSDKNNTIKRKCIQLVSVGLAQACPNYGLPWAGQ